MTWLGENKERAPFAVSTVLLLAGGAAWLLSEFGADREAGAGMVPASAAGGAAGVARVPAARPAGVADRGSTRRLRGRRRHALRALLLLPPRPHARLPGGADPARIGGLTTGEIADAFYVPARLAAV